ncbi:MAG: hypothetical protein ACRD4R_03225 [Candidatus Acidiferrales bacterium]
MAGILKSAWQKYAVLNAGMVLGCLASVFMLPGSTPVWIWVSVCVAVIAMMNFFAFTRLRKDNKKQSSSGSRFTTAVVFVGFLIFALDLAFHLIHHSR